MIKMALDEGKIFHDVHVYEMFFALFSKVLQDKCEIRLKLDGKQVERKTTLIK